MGAIFAILVIILTTMTSGAGLQSASDPREIVQIHHAPAETYELLKKRDMEIEELMVSRELVFPFDSSK